MLEEYPDDYDGFYFFPHDDETGSGVRYDFFRFKDEYAGGVKQDATEAGDMYHIAFIEADDEGVPEVKETFDAIFVDPVIYAENLFGTNLIGCIVRKTDKSQKWFEDHLTSLREKCKLIKIKDQIESIAKN